MSQDFFRSKTKLVGAGVLVLDLAFLVAGVWFLTSKIADSSAGLKKKKAEIESVYQNWQALSKSQKELQKAKVDLGKINGAFVSLDSPYDFIGRLEDLAKSTATGYEVNLLNLGAGNQDQEKAVTFQITFLGNFNNLMRFLKLLENMQYYTKIESLQISEIRKNGVRLEGELKNLPAGSVRGLITLKAFTG